MKDIIQPKRKLELKPTKNEHDIPGTFAVQRGGKAAAVSDWSLRTSDIDRCRSALRPDNDPFVDKLARASQPRRQYRSINATADIEGALRTHQRLSTPKKKERAETRASALASRPAEGEALDLVASSLAAAASPEPPGSQGALRMWNTFRKVDREASGKVSGPELTKALQASVGLRCARLSASRGRIIACRCPLGTHAKLNSCAPSLPSFPQPGA